jgi:hypothetical protein
VGFILRLPLKNNTEYNWEKISKDRFGISLKANSFEQGFTTVSFIKAIDSTKVGAFKLYFIYYDPVWKKGWFKTLEYRFNQGREL